MKKFVLLLTGVMLISLLVGLSPYESVNIDQENDDYIVSPLSSLVEIRTLQDLDDIRLDLDGDYILKNNIDASSVALWNNEEGWNPLGNETIKFSGSFDGSNYTVSNLTINNTQDYIGLFGYVNEEGVIKNLNLTFTNIVGDNKTGGLVGWGNGTITNCHSSGNVSGITVVGGLIGGGWGKVSDCSSDTNVTGDMGVGGLAGGVGGTGEVSNSHSRGSVVGVNYTGGFVGINNGTVTHCSSQSEVIGEIATGGFVGINNGTVTHCSSQSEVIGEIGTGGFVGFNYGTVASSSSSGSVLGYDDFAGGFVGFNEFVIENSSSSCDIDSKDYVGGFAGVNIGAINDSYSLGDVNGDWRVGGFIGWNEEGTVERCYSSGAVSGEANVGGFAGINFNIDSIIRYSYSTSNVEGDLRAGGFIGNNNGRISNCYSQGPVTGGDYAAGFAGANNVNGIITNSYSTGAVSGSSFLRGFVSQDLGLIDGSYWDKESSGRTLDEGGDGVQGKTTAQMEESSTYADWDFDSLWWMIDGENYPELLNVARIIINIDVTVQPNLVYDEGESLDLSGMQVTLIYSSGPHNTYAWSEIGELSSNLLNGTDLLQNVHNGIIINISHEDDLWAFTEPLSVNAIVTAITIQEQPLLVYDEGQELDLSALVVNLTWSNGSWSLVPFGDFLANDLSVSVPNDSSLTTVEHHDLKIGITHNPSGFCNYTDVLSVVEVADEEGGICTVPFAIMLIFGMSAIAMRRR